MRPGAVRDHVVEDHRRIRAHLNRIEEQVERLLANPLSDPKPLRTECALLVAQLARHMKWEDEHLAPALRDADGWGDARALQLERDHHSQRELLDFVLSAILEGGRPSVLLARTIREFITLVRDDMEEEEASLLDPKVLRDDVVGIDVEAG